MTRYLFFSVLIVLLLSGPQVLHCADGPAAQVHAVRVAGVINPVVADFITAELDAANAGNARAFMIELDTPGGLDSAMRTIIQQILGSRLPVIVYVSPSGARGHRGEIRSERDQGAG